MIKQINKTANYYSNIIKLIILILIINNSFGYKAISKDNSKDTSKEMSKGIAKIDKILINDNGIKVKLNFNEILDSEKLSDNIQIVDNELVYSNKLISKINNIYFDNIQFIKNIDNDLKFETLKLNFISNFNEKPEVKLKINKIDTIRISLTNKESKINSILGNYNFLNVNKSNKNNIEKKDIIKLNLISKIIRNNKIYSVNFSPINYLNHSNEFITLEFYSDIEIIIDYKNSIKNDNQINKDNKVSKKELSFLPNLVIIIKLSFLLIIMTIMILI